MAACQGNMMNNAEKDPDDTFSDLLKIVAFTAIVIVGLGIWYLCA
jgi:hypothetical protein|nr:hypothetical protein [Serratia fonticola]